MSVKDLKYYKNNCEEDYIKTPISVLKYISELEEAIEKQNKKTKSFYCERQTNLLKQCKSECDYCKSLKQTKQFLCGNEYRNKEKRCIKQCCNCQGNI